jgi:hypothetical protein
MVHEEGSRKGQFVTLEELMERAEEGMDYNNPFSSAQNSHYLKNAIKGDDVEWREEIASSEPDVLERVDNVAAKLVLMDGIILEKATEPTFSFIRGVGWSVDCWPNNNPTQVYRLDETHHSIFEGTAEHGYPWADKVEIFKPEVLKYDAATPSVLAMVWNVLDGWKRWAHEWSKERFCAYADVRDVLKQTPKDHENRPTVVTSDLLAAVAAYAEAFGADCSGDIMREALERWDGREAPSLEDLNRPTVGFGQRR